MSVSDENYVKEEKTDRRAAKREETLFVCGCTHCLCVGVHTVCVRKFARARYP